MAKENKKRGNNQEEKIEKNRENKDKNQEVQSTSQDNQGNLQSSCSRLQGTLKIIEKLRKSKSLSSTLILKNYNSALSLSILQIIAILYRRVEPTEILVFIGFKHARFLEILLLMLEEQLPIVSSDNKINYQNQLINQEILRSFSFGVKGLREKEELTNPNTPIDLDEVDIKCLYVSYLLLLGVGQISPKMKCKQKEETTEHHFHRIVTHLLKRNEFLVPKLFYLITNSWSKIMDIVYKEIQLDEKKRLVQQFEQNKESQDELISSYLNKDEEAKYIQQEKNREKCSEDQDSWIINFEDCISHVKDYRSHDQDESKYFKTEKLNDRQTEKQRNRRVFGNAEQQMQQKEGKNQFFQGAEKQNDKNISLRQQCQNYQALLEAKLSFNYPKFQVIKKGSKSKKIQKGEKKQYKKGQEKNYIQNAYQGDRFFTCDEERDLYNKEGVISKDESMEEICNHQYEDEELEERAHDETLQLSETANMVNKFQEIQLEGETLLAQENPNLIAQIQPSNPNRAVRHENRQIDYLVRTVLSNRESFIESIANHIYFEMMVWNIRLMR